MQPVWRLFGLFIMGSTVHNVPSETQHKPIECGICFVVSKCVLSVWKHVRGETYERITLPVSITTEQIRYAEMLSH